MYGTITYIWLIFGKLVSKYASRMDPVGYKMVVWKMVLSKDGLVFQLEVASFPWGKH